MSGDFSRPVAPLPGGDEPPGVPKLRTWRGVYLFVLGCFAVLVGLLAWFTYVFAR